MNNDNLRNISLVESANFQGIKLVESVDSEELSDRQLAHVVGGKGSTTQGVAEVRRNFTTNETQGTIGIERRF
jgi:hypothetical protein